MRRSSQITYCNFCSAEIMWLVTPRGARMPVNATPDPRRGNVRRNGTLAQILSADDAAAARDAGAGLRVHHATTCPHAARWSKQRPKAEPAVASAPEPTLFDGGSP